MTEAVPVFERAFEDVTEDLHVAVRMGAESHAGSRQDYPEYWEIIGGWLRSHKHRPEISGEFDGADSLLTAVASGLGVAMLAARTAGHSPRGIRWLRLRDGPEPLCIAACCRTDRVSDGPLAVFVEELRKAARTKPRTPRASRMAGISPKRKV